RLISIHESRLYHFCVTEGAIVNINVNCSTEGESVLQKAGRLKIRDYRIHKSSRRVAFYTEEEAFEHLRLRKRKQLRHLERDIEFAKAFLRITDGASLDEFQSDPPIGRIVPNTEELVNEHYRFD